VGTDLHETQISTDIGSIDNFAPGLRIGLIEESLTPLHKTDGEIAMPIKGR
jgi:hypothetical protein